MSLKVSSAVSIVSQWNNQAKDLSRAEYIFRNICGYLRPDTSLTNFIYLESAFLTNLPQCWWSDIHCRQVLIINIMRLTFWWDSQSCRDKIKRLYRSMSVHPTVPTIKWTAKLRNRTQFHLCMKYSIARGNLRRRKYCKKACNWKLVYY